MASLVDCHQPNERIVDDEEKVIREEERQERRRKYNESRLKRIELSKRQQAELFEAFDNLNATIAKFRAESEAWKDKVIDESQAQIQRIDAQSQALKDGNVTVKKTFAKGDIVWYHRASQLTGQEEMLLVTVIGVHHDDYPNVYYTIQPVRPLQFINGRNSNTELTMTLFEEKQTDSAHLLHLDER